MATHAGIRLSDARPGGPDVAAARGALVAIAGVDICQGRPYWLASNMLHAVATIPKVFIPELIGMGFLLLAAVKVFSRRRFLYALQTAHID